jgi:hypothetical protein
MGNIDKLFKIEKLHKLIKSEFMGTSDDYANILRVSRGTLHNYIEDLKFAGAEIAYSRIGNCYKYLNEFEFEIKVNAKCMTPDEMNKICGGSNFFKIVHFFRLDTFNFANDKRKSCPDENLDLLT